MREPPVWVAPLGIITIAALSLIYILNGVSAVRRKEGRVLGYPKDYRTRGSDAVQSGAGLICIGLGIALGGILMFGLPQDFVCLSIFAPALVSAAGVILHFSAGFRDPALAKRLREYRIFRGK